MATKIKAKAKRPKDKEEDKPKDVVFRVSHDKLWKLAGMVGAAVLAFLGWSYDNMLDQLKGFKDETKQLREELREHDKKADERFDKLENRMTALETASKQPAPVQYMPYPVPVPTPVDAGQKAPAKWEQEGVMASDVAVHVQKKHTYADAESWKEPQMYHVRSYAQVDPDDSPDADRQSRREVRKVMRRELRKLRRESRQCARKSSGCSSSLPRTLDKASDTLAKLQLAEMYERALRSRRR